MPLNTNIDNVPERMQNIYIIPLNVNTDNDNQNLPEPFLLTTWNSNFYNFAEIALFKPFKNVWKLWGFLLFEIRIFY